MRNRRYETREPIFAAFSPGIKFTNLLLVFVMPAVASFTYPFYLRNNISANKYVELILLPIISASAAMFVVSVAKILLMKKKSPAPEVSTADSRCNERDMKPIVP
jgi:hypothetical protein